MTPFVRADIKHDESYARRLPDGNCQAYPDPLTKAAPWTIGWGHCGPEVHPALIWTEAQAEAAFERDFNAVVEDLDDTLPWWRSLNDARQDVLVNMTFNMGIGRPPQGKDRGHGVLGFPNTLAAIKRGSYSTAAENLRVSKWERQTHGRADRLADQLEKGVRCSP